MKNKNTMNKTKQTTELATINKNKFFDFCFANREIFKWISYSLFIFLCLFMLIANLFPVNSGYSTISFFNSNAMYAVKFNSSFTSYFVIFAPAGWFFIFLLIISLVFFSLTIFLFLDDIEKQFIECKNYKKIEKRKYFFHLSFNISLIIIFIILVFYTLIPPNYHDLEKYLFLSEKLSIGQQSTDKQEIIDILINYFGYTDKDSLQTKNLGTLLNYLGNVQFANSFWFSPVAWFSYDVCYFSFGYWLLIAFFVLFFGYSAIGWTISYLLEIYPKFAASLKFDFSFFKKWKETYKENKINKNKIKEIQKLLNRQENELLKNLYEFNVDQKPDEVEKISQSELQEKIAKNNLIKKQLDEIMARKAEIKKQQLANSKFKKAIDKLNVKNDSLIHQKKEKQKITIPDKELDEIFKSLEID